MLSDIPLSKTMLLNTPESEQNMMANTVVATLCAVLFAEIDDREKAYNKAYDLWTDWIAAR
jgi:hypothetical protein